MMGGREHVLMSHSFETFLFGHNALALYHSHINTVPQ